MSGSSVVDWKINLSRTGYMYLLHEKSSKLVGANRLLNASNKHFIYSGRHSNDKSLLPGFYHLLTTLRRPVNKFPLHGRPITALDLGATVPCLPIVATTSSIQYTGSSLQCSSATFFILPGVVCVNNSTSTNTST